MKLSLSSTCAFVLATAVTISAGGGYLGSCKDVNIRNNFLNANCRRADQSYHYTELHLSDFLTNVWGITHWRQGGGAMASCKVDYFLPSDPDGYLVIQCINDRNLYSSSGKLTNNHIFNSNGNLIYDGYQGIGP